MEELVNKTLGQFQIQRELGRGGMAVVYEAYQPTLQRKVALKVLLPNLGYDAEFVRRFQQEAVSAAGLRHPNIVTIHDVGAQDRYNYIVMEYLEGRPLADLIRAMGPMPLARIAKIIDQVAQALDYAHKRGFVHRDIKPSNVMVGEDDHATLTDFGIAKALSGARLTQTGMVIGTPEYMSPEQVKGEDVDGRTDVYSLGIVAYEMITGQVPFSGTTASVLYKQANEPPPPLRTHVPSVNPVVESVITRALAKPREDRFATAGRFAQALTSVGTAAHPVTLQPQPAPPAVSAPLPQPAYAPPPQPTYVPPQRPVYAPPPQPTYPPSQPVYAPPPRPVYAPAPSKPRAGGPPAGLMWLLGGVGVALVLCAIVVGAIVLFGRQSPATPAPQAGGPVVNPPPVVLVVSATPPPNVPQPPPNVPQPPPPTNAPLPPPPPGPSREQVEAAVRDAVERFQKAKEYSQRTGDTSHLPEDLAGQALDRQIELVNSTKAANCYWEIWLNEPMKYEFLEVRGDTYARVRVYKVETRHKFCNGKPDPSGSVDKEAYDTTYGVEQIKGRWYVTQRE